MSARDHRRSVLIAAAQTDVVESDGTNALAINDLRNTRS
jgi:hypothetical protein